MTPKDEQESSTTCMRTDAYAIFYTSDTRHLVRLRKMATVEDYIDEIRGGEDWAEFRVQASHFNPMMAIRKKRPRSAAQIAADKANGERLAQRRAEGNA